MKLFIGLMSGTSMDGIDAALVDVATNTLVAGITRPYSQQARQSLNEVLNTEFVHPSRISQLNSLIGREFALAVNQLLAQEKINPNRVEAIGSHGQTIYHDATAKIPYTIQVGCAHTIAELTGIQVVADFRARDLVNGGKGAPFAPIYHQAHFSKRELPMAVINIGGITNATFLEKDNKIEGHDIGPGNCLMDAWIHQHLNLAFDANGSWGATGSILAPLLTALLDDPYFNYPAPKSLGKEYFSKDWLMPKLKKNYAPHDVQATLLAFTATSITNDIKKRSTLPKCIAVCGGGVHNGLLIETLKTQLPTVQIESTETFGVDPDFMEAMMFAWFAEKTISHTPLDLKAITGANHPSILGAIYAAGIDKGNSIDV